MRFLANENFPGEAVATLRSAGHDVVWVRSDAPGARDEDILDWAMRDGRVLLTFDKDFGVACLAFGTACELWSCTVPAAHAAA